MASINQVESAALHITSLLRNAQVREIRIGGGSPPQVWVKQLSQFEPVREMIFTTGDDVKQWVSQLLETAGRSVASESTAITEILPGGTRLTALFPPLVTNGPWVILRNPGHKPELSYADLLRNAGLNPITIQFLKAAVEARINIVIAGPRESGKSALLSLLTQCIPGDERLLSLEDHADLRIANENLIRFQPDDSGQSHWYNDQFWLLSRGELRPDRVVIDEIRECAALPDFLLRLGSRIDGVLFTLEAGSPRAALVRLESMALRSNPYIPVHSLRKNLVNGLDILVQMERGNDGLPRIQQIEEIYKLDNDLVQVQPIYRLQDAKLVPTGIIPESILKIQNAGIHLPRILFRPLGQTQQKRKSGLLGRLRSRGSSDRLSDPYFDSRFFEEEPPSQIDFTDPTGMLEVLRTAWTRRSRAPVSETPLLGSPSIPAVSPEIYKRIEELVVKKISLLHEMNPSVSLIRNTIMEAYEAALSAEKLELTRIEKHKLFERIANDLLGLGPLTPLLEDETITEVMVNGLSDIFIERRGRLYRAEAAFESEKQLIRLIDRIVAPLGRRVDETSPYVVARLPDGSVITATVPPFTPQGPTLTIRKFARSLLTIDHLIQFGTVSVEAVQFIQAIVEAGCNIIISGGMGAGATTLANVISGLIPKDERIITVENVAAFQLRQEHVLTLETRPANRDGKGGVSFEELLRDALDLHPDRLWVAEPTDDGALALLDVMNIDGLSVTTTIQSVGPEDAVSRLEMLALADAGNEIPARWIRQRIASGLDFIIYTERMRDGTRKVTSISEIGGMKEGEIILRPIFHFEATGYESGRVIGRHRSTGNIPLHYMKFIEMGISLPKDLFYLKGESRQSFETRLRKQLGEQG